MITRREFVTGLAATSIVLPFGRSLATSPRASADPPILAGNEFRLGIGYQSVNFTGKERMATTINGSLPAPTLRWREGDRVSLKVSNNLAHDSSIHWHGMILPPEMDGVPGISFPGIKPGSSYHYEFDVKQSGTYWYHSHSGFQEQTGMYGAIIIDPQEPEPFAYDRDYVVIISDWSDEKPEDIFANLKKDSHYYNRNLRTIGDWWRDVRANGFRQTANDRAMWNQMRMADSDLADVTAATYTYLTNGHTPAAGWTGLFAPGEKIRLRFINAAAMTIFDVRIPGLDMKVVASDGQNIEPVTVEEIRIGVAETYDVIVAPQSDSAYTIFAQSLDRSGYTRGVLTPDASLQPEIPAMDPPAKLGHGDMGMSHAQMDHAGMGHADMDHAGHEMQNDSGRAGRAGHGSVQEITHRSSEFGPQVDMRAEAPQVRLDDPGIGLRGNGRRVLTYSELFNISATPDPREPGREIQLHLTGNMERYLWSIDGIPFADADPLQLTYGERVRITLVNDTMMNHPIHLHGMWTDLETGDGKRIPRKHTVIVQPGSKVSYLVTADARGGWAYHCHLLYHMMGMFREVRVG